jgi:Uma2 family endonuclease
MASVSRPRKRREPTQRQEKLPPLENGDHLDQKTFHARYEAMPESTRAELIAGVVIMPSPLKKPHGREHGRLTSWVFQYVDATPGTDVFVGATTNLGPDSEPQPDVNLLIAPTKGGQTREEDEYIVGLPELIGEVASSTESYDLHSKKRDYERAGAREYLVIALRQSLVFWFVLRQGKFEGLPPGPDGILRSEVFPGLWLDPAAFLRQDWVRVRDVLQLGLATPDHAAFVARLADK